MIFVLILNNNDISRYLWTYLTIKDILYLMQINKDTQNKCLQINRLVPQSITLNKKRNNNKIKLSDIVISFPNVNSLDLTNCYRTLCNKDLSQLF